MGTLSLNWSFFGRLLSVVVPSPSCPSLFWPQQYICTGGVSGAVYAQVWLAPADTAAIAGNPDTTFGSTLASFVPSPSWP